MFKKLLIILLVSSYFANATYINQSLWKLSSNSSLIIQDSDCAYVDDGSSLNASNLSVSVCVNSTNHTWALSEVDFLRNLTIQLNSTINQFNGTSNSNLSKMNVVINLSYSTNCLLYNDTNLRTVCLQMLPPKIQYTNSTYNITVNAPEFPSINRTINMQGNQINQDYLGFWGLSIASENSCIIPNLNAVMTLNSGECFSNTTYNVTVCSNATTLRSNIITAITDGQRFFDPASNITVSCVSSNDTLANLTQVALDSGFYCFKDANLSGKCNNIYKIQASTASAMNICLDNLTDVCMPAEILAGDWKTCFTRYSENLNISLTNSKLSLENSNQQVSQLTKNVQEWQTGQNIVDAKTKNDSETRLVISILALVFVIVYVGFKIVSRRLKTRTQQIRTEQPDFDSAVRQGLQKILTPPSKSEIKKE